MAKDKYGIISDEQKGIIMHNGITYDFNEIEHDNVILALIVRGGRRDFAQAIGGIVKECIEKYDREPTPDDLTAKFKRKFETWKRGELTIKKAQKSPEQAEADKAWNALTLEQQQRILDTVKQNVSDNV